MIHSRETLSVNSLKPMNNKEESQQVIFHELDILILDDWSLFLMEPLKTILFTCPRLHVLSFPTSGSIIIKSTHKA